MIFATVGTTELPFDRLVRAVDELARELDEAIIIQTGHSTYRPRHAQWFRFTTTAQMQEWFAHADVVVTHGGIGSIRDCVRAGKRIVACPRRADLGEAVNPQDELVTHLAKRGIIVALDDVADLAKAIERARIGIPAAWPFESTVPELVARFIDSAVSR